MKKASVIGAGIGGLAIAVRLAVNGYKVSVFESNSYPGGKAAEFKTKGFRFDKGPSLLTMPEKIDELFLLAGRTPRDYFKYSKINESCRYFYEDGTVIKAYSDVMKFSEELFNQTKTPKHQTINYLKENEFIFKATSYLFLEKSLHKLKTYLSFKVLLSALKIPFLNLFSTMNEINNKRFKNEKVVQIFNRYATYNGSDPYLAPGVLNSISNLEFKRGAFSADNGMSTIPKSIYKLALELGVVFYFNSSVEEIRIEKNEVEGVVVGKDLYSSDLVVCNTDIYYIYNKLLPEKYSLKQQKNSERSSSAIIFYWGIDKIFDKLQLHNILFTQSYKNEFKHIRDGISVYEDPTIYINITSKKKKSDAPKNSENWFVMINVPHNKDQDWDKLVMKSKKDIIKKINRVLNISIEDNIIYENVIDPRNIESETRSFKGALYGTSSNTKAAAFFRHPNFSKDVKGLYFCGGSVHPGGGIPLVLSSAKIVDELIKKDYEKK